MRLNLEKGRSGTQEFCLAGGNYRAGRILPVASYVRIQGSRWNERIIAFIMAAVRVHSCR